jgi:hypothetical protein
MAKRTVLQDEFTREWIIRNSIQVVSQYRPGELTIRALHYQLVGLGMTNTMRHYKRVVMAMEEARWEGLINFNAFSDLERRMEGETRADETDVASGVSDAKQAITAWMNYYSKNRWENQPNYVEVFIEKKALQNVFQPVCTRNNLGLGPVKGYPSLTFLHETAERFKMRENDGKNLIILYFGDYDPSGEDIPRSIQANLERMGVEVDVRRKALTLEQVEFWNLPHAPTKETDSRTAAWDGIGQVELDAVRVEDLRELCQDAIDEVFDEELFEQLEAQEEIEQEDYVAQLKEYVKTL